MSEAQQPKPTPEALTLVDSPDAPPLLRARQARKLELDDLVAGLLETLHLGDAAHADVRRYYQELELGQLDPAGVTVDVWVALASLLGRDAQGTSGASAPAAYRIANFDDAFLDPMAIPSLAKSERPHQPAPDEVDRLFGVAPADG